MPKFVKKPIVVEARQWDSSNTEELCDWINTRPHSRLSILNVAFQSKNMLVIPTLEGDHDASKGDWIIKGISGEFYPCKPDIFEATYEEVTDA